MEAGAALSGLYLALIHYPVVNRNGEIIVSSVTNLDIHDLARAGRTFGVKGYFVVHPSGDQQALNRRIIHHWEGSYGTDFNPTRKDALSLVRLVSRFDEVVEAIQKETGQAPLRVGTSARAEASQRLSLEALKTDMGDRPVLLVFGTAYGLAPTWQHELDGYLAPIQGPTDFNHLSVRSAVSIYLDRLAAVRA